MNEESKFKGSIGNGGNSFKPVVSNGIAPSKVEACADWLVEQLSAPNSRRFYCLVAMRLDEPTIVYLLEKALRESPTPARLFGYLTQKEMEHRKIQQAVSEYDSI